ncbi:MAG: tetratricopeptide repeat protein [Thermodesulfovibrionales bacterium]
MDDNSYIELIENGIAYLNDNNRLAALACFDKAFIIGKSPELLSYLSYCIATERGQIYEALKLCNNALSQETDNPVHYLNLGRIYLHAGKKEEALLILRKGLSFGDNQAIRSILEKIGTRGKPVFPFISRNNFLNKYVGILLHWIKLR